MGSMLCSCSCETGEAAWMREGVCWAQEALLPQWLDGALILGNPPDQGGFPWLPLSVWLPFYGSGDLPNLQMLPNPEKGKGAEQGWTYCHSPLGIAPILPSIHTSRMCPLPPTFYTSTDCCNKHVNKGRKEMHHAKLHAQAADKPLRRTAQHSSSPHCQRKGGHSEPCRKGSGAFQSNTYMKIYGKNVMKLAMA